MSEWPSHVACAQAKHGGIYSRRSSVLCQASGRSDAGIRRPNVDDNDSNLPSISRVEDSDSNGALTLDANPVGKVRY